MLLGYLILMAVEVYPMARAMAIGEESAGAVANTPAEDNQWVPLCQPIAEMLATSDMIDVMIDAKETNSVSGLVISKW